MGKRLVDNLNSHYIGAANRLKPKRAQQRIIAYVESYDDVFFWRTLLSEFEDDKYRFEVMLPSTQSLAKGKKMVLMNQLGCSLGQNMIACVDSDYDYLLQNTHATSRRIIHSKYVFHTYTYAIENYQCYAESLHQVCVMATLNDRQLIDFPAYMEQYSRIAYPLFIWSVWFYRKNKHGRFSLLDFCNIVKPDHVNIRQPETSLQRMQQMVDRKLKRLERDYTFAKREVDALRGELGKLGVRPENTYLFIQGHHIFNNVVMKLLGPVCAQLRREREVEIKELAEHDTQLHNELSSYQRSQASPEFMLKKQMGYKDCEFYQRLREDIRHFLDSLETPKK